MIVVDASLATKWFLAERDSELALAFLQRAEADVCGPDILGLEVALALVAATNARGIDRATALRALGTWFDKLESATLPLYIMDWRLVARAADIAIELGHPLTDCIYLALALDLDCDLVTCDAKFRDRATARYPGVRLFAELS